MGEWTPGPWIAQPDPHGTSDDWCIGVGDQIDRVAVCSANDARLIAAAPELAEALKEARPCVEEIAGAASAAPLRRRRIQRIRVTVSPWAAPRGVLVRVQPHSRCAWRIW